MEVCLYDGVSGLTAAPVIGRGLLFVRGDEEGIGGTLDTAGEAGEIGRLVLRELLAQQGPCR